MNCWIDTHCHLDSSEFAQDRLTVIDQARCAGVHQLVLPAVDLAGCAAVRDLAHAHNLVYALGIHPWAVALAPCVFAPVSLARMPHGGQPLSWDGPATVADEALQGLHDLLSLWQSDVRCVAVGEIGLDDFAPPSGTSRSGRPSTAHPAYWQRQIQFFTAQLQMAREFDLPVIVHVRRCVDELLNHLRRARVRGGIVHAFNGSMQQAHALIDLGFKLGFGGAMTFERALQIRRLAQTLPLEAIVLETDSPDMPPHWLYRTAQQRSEGHQTSRNKPAELPRIAQTLADLRGIELDCLATTTNQNAREALPKLQFMAC
jgi:TatD DNase family protein